MFHAGGSPPLKRPAPMVDYGATLPTESGGLQGARQGVARLSCACNSLQSRRHNAASRGGRECETVGPGIAVATPLSPPLRCWTIELPCQSSQADHKVLGGVRRDCLAFLTRLRR
jgi:hypothetical protein